MQVVRGSQDSSGERVSNVSLTYPYVWDSRGKLRVIPGDITVSHEMVLKGKPQRERAISYQLVGEVTAHQGNDA